MPTRTATNSTFAVVDPLFRKACELAGVVPTKRQASKWHNRRGLAYGSRHQAESALKESAV